MTLRTVLVALAVMVVALVGIRLLADAALTTHDYVDPDSQVEIVVRGRVSAQAEYNLPHGVDSLVRFCRLEVGRSALVAPLEQISDDEFRFIFQPALDDADQRQFRGCVNDMTVDHMLASVESMTLLNP